MTNPNTGRFAWHELMSSDVALAAKFYSSLFGWTVDEMPMSAGGTYRIFKKGDVQIGGAMTSPPGVPAHWMVYVDVNDADASVKKITELGGTIVVPTTGVPNMLRFAVAKDPQGAVFGVMQNTSSPNPQPYYEGTPRIGSFCWNELHTTSMDAAAKFYGALFGWTGKLGETDTKYWHWKNAGKDVGGMMSLMTPNVPPHWLGYLAASDVDASTAKVRELGGKVMMAPMEIEKVGKFSIAQDPTGATFALFRSAHV